MGRVPKWADWMAEKPGEGNLWPAYHRFFWRRVVPQEVRFWLAFAAVMVLFSVVLLIAVIVDAA